MTDTALRAAIGVIFRNIAAWGTYTEADIASIEQLIQTALAEQREAIIAGLPEKQPYEDGDHEDNNWERRFIKAAHNNVIDTIKQQIEELGK